MSVIASVSGASSGGANENPHWAATELHQKKLTEHKRRVVTREAKQQRIEGDVQPHATSSEPRQPTPTDVFNSVLTRCLPANRAKANLRTTMSLEEVLYTKLKLEERRFVERSYDELRREKLENPGFTRAKGRKVNTFIEEAVPKMFRKAADVKTFQRQKSLFERQIDLPTLGVSLRVDSTTQYFNFASLPNREEARRLQDSYLQQSSILPMDETPTKAGKPVAEESFLQYLFDKAIQMPDIHNKEIKSTSVELSSSEQQPSGSGLPSTATAPLKPTKADMEAVNPFTTTQIAIPSPPEGPSERAASPQAPFRRVKSAGATQGRATPSGVGGGEAQTPNRDSEKKNRPSTAAAVAATATTPKRPKMSCIGMHPKSKQHHLTALLERQRTLDEQLQMLMFRQKQVEDLKAQVEELQAKQKANAELPASTTPVEPPTPPPPAPTSDETQPEASPSDSAIQDATATPQDPSPAPSAPTITTIDDELKARLAALQEQQTFIEQLHQKILSSYETGWLQERMAKQQEAMRVQEQAKLLLLQKLHEHNTQEAIAKQRVQQRHQRYNALLWNRNRYETHRGANVPPIQPTNFNTKVTHVAPTASWSPSKLQRVQKRASIVQETTNESDAV